VVPSVVCYDADGNIVAVGSETNPGTNPELSKIGGLCRVEWYGIVYLLVLVSTKVTSEGLNPVCVRLLPGMSKNSGYRHCQNVKLLSRSLVIFIRSNEAVYPRAPRV